MNNQLNGYLIKTRHYHNHSNLILELNLKIGLLLPDPVLPDPVLTDSKHIKDAVQIKQADQKLEIMEVKGQEETKEVTEVHDTKEIIKEECKSTDVDIITPAPSRREKLNYLQYFNLTTHSKRNGKSNIYLFILKNLTNLISFANIKWGERDCLDFKNIFIKNL